MEANFSDYINDAVRVLVLLNAVKERKSMKVTEHKIKLYDYYLRLIISPAFTNNSKVLLQKNLY